MLNITHGPHIGRIASNSVRIWLRLDKQGFARILYLQEQGELFHNEASEEELLEKFNGDGEDSKSKKKEAIEVNDYTITIDIKGLKADTAYIYVVEASNDGNKFSKKSIADKEKFVGYFRTFPKNGSLQEELVFAFGSCFHRYIKNEEIFVGLDKKSQKENGFRFLLLLGDQIYADYVPKKLIKKNSGEWEKCLPIIANFIPLFNYYFKFKEAADFEAYKYVYRLFWDSIPFRKALMRIPTFMILDDHELRNGWGMQGENDPETRRGKEFDARKKAALEAYELYQHTLNPKTPVGKYWYSFNFSDIGFFVLDTRTKRDKNLELIVDENQMQALKDWLKKEKENYKLKFIVSSVPIAHISFSEIVSWFFPADVNDHWAGFPKQRDELLDFIFDKEIKGVHFLSGDAHVSYIDKITENGSKIKVFSFTSSPFAQKPATLYKYLPHKKKLGTRYKVSREYKYTKENFGVVRVTPQNGNYGVSYELYDKSAKKIKQYSI